VTFSLRVSSKLSAGGSGKTVSTGSVTTSPEIPTNQNGSNPDTGEIADR
jgi:hypothetical protein